MVDIAAEHGQLVLETPEAPRMASSRRLTLHALSPVLVGLAAPLVALAIAHPVFLDEMGPVALWVLALVFLGALAIYAQSVLFPGDVVAATFDTAGCVVTLLHAGRFATSRREIHFSAVAGVTLANGADGSGEARKTAMLHLKSGRSLKLPAGTEASHVLSAREVMGLA